MTPVCPRKLLLPLAVGAAFAVSGCGDPGVDLARTDPLYEGAALFNQRCAGCHSYDFADAEGSAAEVHDRERKDGPSFDQRKEQYEDVLYAIQNGGFSSGPMPQNIVTGRQARIVACFVATYSGREAEQEQSPGGATETRAAPGDCREQIDSN